MSLFLFLRYLYYKNTDMATRLFTGTTCGNNSTITFTADDTVITGNPLNRIYQLDTGVCFTLTASGGTVTSGVTAFVAYGPYTSCTQCLTPVNSGGIVSADCKDCGTGTFTSSTFNQAIYTNGQNRAIRQNNSVSLGGFNGLNN